LEINTLVIIGKKPSCEKGNETSKPDPNLTAYMEVFDIDTSRNSLTNQPRFGVNFAENSVPDSDWCSVISKVALDVCERINLGSAENVLCKVNEEGSPRTICNDFTS
jgi:hypothetical protein